MSGFSLSLPARAENVAVVRHACGGLGEALDLSERLVADIKLAVTEACTNVVVHAYPDTVGDMEIQVDVDPDHLSISVVDDGAGMTPHANSGGLGLGLPLIATLASSMELTSDQRTEIRITFDLGPGSDAAPLPTEGGG
jgi:serine/threonine-protein kinase RsbW